MPQSGPKSFSRVNLIWSLLFFDVLVLTLRTGGFALADLLFHALCLGIATFLLIRGDRVYPIPRAVPLVAGAVLVLGLIQLIPLPQALFEILAPIKARAVHQTTALFPAITYTTQITMVPELHVMRLSGLCLDIYLVMILFMTPPPDKKVFETWLYILSLTINSLLLMKNGPLLEHGPLSLYAGTFGGFINSNHYSVLNCVFMLLLLSTAFGAFQRVIKAYKEASLDNKQKLVREMWTGSFSMFCYFMCLFGFQNVGSRSGIILIVISHLMFFGLIASKRLLSRGSISIPMLTGGIVVMLILFAMAPFGESVDKLQTYGLDGLDRWEANLAGLSYLGEMPILGAGLGASAGILDPAMPNYVYTELIWTHFHNEYLEIAVELGLIGFGATVFFFVGVVMLLRVREKRIRFKTEIFISAIVVMVVILSLSSMVSFPLRVTSIRVFFLVTLAVGIQTVSLEKSRRFEWRPAFSVFFCTFLLGVLSLGYGFLRAQSYDGPEAARLAAAEGAFYKTHRIEAATAFGQALSGDLDVAAQKAAFGEVRQKFLNHLRGQPYSVRSLNALAALDILEARLDGMPFDRTQFEAQLEKCKKISALADKNNFQAQMTLLYLLEQNESDLSETEAALLSKLRGMRDQVEPVPAPEP